MINNQKIIMITVKSIRIQKQMIKEQKRETLSIQNDKAPYLDNSYGTSEGKNNNAF